MNSRLSTWFLLPICLGAVELFACGGTAGSGPAANPDAAPQGSGGLPGAAGTASGGRGGAAGATAIAGSGGSGTGGGAGGSTGGATGSGGGAGGSTGGATGSGGGAGGSTGGATGSGGGAGGSTGKGGVGGTVGSGGASGRGGASGTGGGGGVGRDAGTTDSCSWRNQAAVTVATPFAAPDNSLTFTPPEIPCAMFPITSYGAKTTGSNTAAFAATVAAASRRWRRGGRPLGTMDDRCHPPRQQHRASPRIGSFTISFTTTVNATEYPTVLTRWEGLDVMNWSPMIYALGATNVAITGAGTLQGPGNSWGGGIDNWKTGSAAEAQRIYKICYSALPRGWGPSPPR